MAVNNASQLRTYSARVNGVRRTASSGEPMQLDDEPVKACAQVRFPPAGSALARPAAHPAMDCGRYRAGPAGKALALRDGIHTGGRCCLAADFTASGASPAYPRSD